MRLGTNEYGQRVFEEVSRRKQATDWFVERTGGVLKAAWYIFLGVVVTLIVVGILIVFLQFLYDQDILLTEMELIEKKFDQCLESEDFSRDECFRLIAPPNVLLVDGEGDQ